MLRYGVRRSAFGSTRSTVIINCLSIHVLCLLQSTLCVSTLLASLLARITPFWPCSRTAQRASTRVQNLRHGKDSDSSSEDEDSIEIMSDKDQSKADSKNDQSNYFDFLIEIQNCIVEIENRISKLKTYYNPFHLKCHNSLNDKKVKARAQKVSFKINPG